MTDEMRTGTPMIATNPYGREERYLILREESDRCVARTGDGRYQAFKRTLDPFKGMVWTTVKFPNDDESRVWGWAQSV
jgi:hypothetical protein